MAWTVQNHKRPSRWALARLAPADGPKREMVLQQRGGEERKRKEDGGDLAPRGPQEVPWQEQGRPKLQGEKSTASKRTWLCQNAQDRPEDPWPPLVFILEFET